MATILQSGNFFNITVIAADVTPQDIFKDLGDRLVKRIEFLPGAANDKCVIKHVDENGAVIANLISASGSEAARVYFHEEGQFMKPFIDFSACVLTATHMLIIEIA